MFLFGWAAFQSTSVLVQHFYFDSVDRLISIYTYSVLENGLF